MVVKNKEDERLFFVAATFGKYLEHYAAQNKNVVAEDLLIEYILPSLEGELTDWFKQSPLTDEEIHHCLHYMVTIDDRLSSIEEKEKRRLK